jgi:hypothetical protein
VGRILLYRLLIEIRRSLPNGTGVLESTIADAFTRTVRVPGKPFAHRSIRVQARPALWMYAPDELPDGSDVLAFNTYQWSHFTIAVTWYGTHLGTGMRRSGTPFSV